MPEPGAPLDLEAPPKVYRLTVRATGEVRVLEVGCGTGAVTRELARWPGVAEVVGLDPSPTFLRSARQHVRLRNVRFVEGDARSIQFQDRSFDVVVFHTTLCHVPDPEVALGKAARALRPGGWLAIFDGDYATATVAVAPADPLQACADAWVCSSVHDSWLVRRLPGLLEQAGFALVRRTMLCTTPSRLIRTTGLRQRPAGHGVAREAC